MTAFSAYGWPICMEQAGSGNIDLPYVRETRKCSPLRMDHGLWILFLGRERG